VIWPLKPVPPFDPSYSWLDLLQWYLHWLWQYIREIAPFIAPTAEAEIPAFWFEYFSANDWLWNVDDDWVPNETCIRNALWALRRLIRRWIEEYVDYIKEVTINYVQSSTGSVLHLFDTFSDWIENLWVKVGLVIPWWCDDVVDGLGDLYGWLPPVIRTAVNTWDDIWDGIKTAVKDWAKDRFDDAKVKALNAWSWVWNTGYSLKDWWDAAAQWLDDFRLNAVARVKGYLGAAWTTLSTFATEACGFYYNLWGGWATDIADFFENCGSYWYQVWLSYADSLTSFLADPPGYIYDRIEDELCKRW